MNNPVKSFLLGVLLLPVLWTPGVSQADSGHATGSGSVKASVRFRIVIPPVLYLQIQTTPLETIQPSMRSENATTAGSQAGVMNLLDVRAYGNVPQKGAMHLSSRSRRSMGGETETPYPDHHQYLWMPQGIVTTANAGTSREKGALSMSSPSKGIYTFHFSGRTGPSGASPDEYRSFILCSP